MIFSIGTTDLSWGNLMLAGNREPLESRLTNLSYTDFLWELNHVKGAPSAASYTPGTNGGGFGNYYVGLITSVPYVRDGKKAATKGSHNQGADNESIAMKGPWYVSYCGLDTIYKTTGNGKYDFHPDGDGNTYYADRIVLKQEMDYALDKNYVNKYQLGTYYTGVGLWWDSWNTVKGGARSYLENNKEVPDGTYFTTTTYSEIFNDYTYNKATGNYAHAEGYHAYVLSSNNAHAEGLSTIIDNAHEAHVEGNSTKAFNGAYSSHAEGAGSYTKGVNAHAENSAYANGKNSHAGGEATAGGTNSFAHGIKGTLASGTNSVALSSGTASGENSVAISGGQATTKNSVAIGVSAKANTNEGAVALGKGISTGADSFSTNTGKSNGTRSVAINNATASGTDSLATGNSSATGTNSVAVNTSSAISTDAFSANKGKAEKDRATGLNSASATGIDSFAANTSTAGGTNSASIGNGNASGDLSFASGFGKANGKGSHAEGNSSTSIGTYSHAEGNNTSATGQYAHTEGNYTKTTNDYEHAQGTFNYSYTGSDAQSASLFEIGDGTADNARHNVVSILRNGNFLVDSKNNAYLNATNDVSIHGRKTLNVTSPDLKLNSDSLHLHSNEYACVRANVSTYLNGSTTTYIGKDQEGKLTSNAYVVGNKKTEYITGNISEYTQGSTNTHRHGSVTINNDSTVDETTTGKITEKFTKGRDTTVSEGNSLTINGLQKENYNNERQAYVTGGCYMYVSEEIGTYIGQGSTTRINGKNNTSIGTGNSLIISGGNTVDITGTNTTKVSGDDNLTVTKSKTDKITNNYTIQDTGTYIASPHVTIGDIAQIANGENSVAIGNKNTSSNQGSVAMGEANNVNGHASVLLGMGLQSTEEAKVSVGRYNKSYTKAIFEVGIGKDGSNRENAFTTYATGVTYFHYQPYVYDAYINSVTYGVGKLYEPSVYPDQSVAVSMAYYNLSYKGLYDTVSRKFSTIGSLSSVKSIDSISRTTTTNTLHYTKHNYNTSTNKYDSNTYTITQNSATEDLAGLMSAQDKKRLDSIWEGDKTIALMNFNTSSCKWTVYKNDGTTSYTVTIVGRSSSNTTLSQSLSIEYGFKAKWTGSWKWISGDNYKNAERCAGTISGTTLPAANTYCTTYTSGLMTNGGTIASQTIYAEKRGLIIDGYPDNYGASNNGTSHSGRIRPASGEDNRSLSVSLGYYYLFFFGAMNAIPSDMSKIKGLSTKNCTNKSISNVQYTTTTGNPYFVFAYPSGFGDVSTIKKNGVEIITTSFLKVGQFDYVNGAGVTINYNVYRTGAGVANMSITIS